MTKIKKGEKVKVEKWRKNKKCFLEVARKMKLPELTLGVSGASPRQRQDLLSAYRIHPRPARGAGYSAGR